MGFDAGKVPEPCEFSGKCDGYFSGSYTCTRSKRDCHTFNEFRTGNITEFKIPYIVSCIAD